MKCLCVIVDIVLCRWLDVVQVGVTGGCRETVDTRDMLNNSIGSVLTVILRTSTGKVLHAHYQYIK